MIYHSHSLSLTAAADLAAAHFDRSRSAKVRTSPGSFLRTKAILRCKSILRESTFSWLIKFSICANARCRTGWLAMTATHRLNQIRTSQARMRGVRRKAESVSLSAEIFTLALTRGSGRNIRRPSIKAYEVGVAKLSPTDKLGTRSSADSV
jgi:hypothetical protein